VPVVIVKPPGRSLLELLCFAEGGGTDESLVSGVEEVPVTVEMLPDEFVLVLEPVDPRPSWLSSRA
jgi:hypothetical protein